MTPAEAQTLIAIAAAFDNRRPDPDAAQAWALALEGLRFNDCRDAIVAHYRASRDWLMPADVRAGVKAIRRARVLAFGTPPDPPPEIAGDPQRYGDWLADTTRAIANGDLTRETYQPPELVGPSDGHRESLRALAGRSVDES